MLLLATTINTLNEKEIRYKVNSEGEDICVVFGLISQGQKVKVELVPGEQVILTNLTSSEKKLDASKELKEEDLAGFLDIIQEIKALNEKEMALFKSLTE